MRAASLVNRTTCDTSLVKEKSAIRSCFLNIDRTKCTADSCSNFNSLAVDPKGNLYAVGYIGTGVVTFSPGVTAGSEASTYNNAVLVRY